jgi:hypothetical protein
MVERRPLTTPLPFPNATIMRILQLDADRLTRLADVLAAEPPSK